MQVRTISRKVIVFGIIFIALLILTIYLFQPVGCGGDCWIDNNGKIQCDTVYCWRLMTIIKTVIRTFSEVFH